ncbi:MAG: xanthine dehydrogenase family protein molybdopterin-binding subunit [Gemmatimonadetes bacterium]|nr:xanthine dehydrogenase family protein molybdopterin-binding subunit [Gemmatimonadota bacterium]
MASRRVFVGQAMRAGAGLMLAVGWRRRLPVRARTTTFRPNAYLAIDDAGQVTIWVARFEMGQGVRTALPMIIAEELDLPWGALQLEFGHPGAAFAALQMHTSGSDSSRSAYRLLRRAGAAAREMLVLAAATEWRVAPESCETAAGVVHHAASGRSASYGSLVSAAATLPVPATPRLKDRARYRLLGTPVRRVDGPAIVTGAARYGLDVRVEGMLCASIEHAPTFGATVVAIDDAAARRVRGVRHVVRVTRGIHQGVAVLADDHWTAMRARAALKVTWSPGAGRGAGFDSDAWYRQMTAAFDARQFPIRRAGDAAGALAAAPRVHEATYRYPFQAHAPLETMNCTAHVRADEAEIWCPTQTDVRIFEQVTKVTGLARERIRLHGTLIGGGFGRRLFADVAAEAAELSQAVHAPVQVLWTRSDDMRFGYFQPATLERLRGVLRADGALQALRHQATDSELTIYDIHTGRDIWRAPDKPPKADDAYASDESPWGAFDFPYEVPHLAIDCADVTSPVPVGPWRSVGYPSTVFARESFLDELARQAGADPVAFRLALLPRDVTKVGRYAIDRARLAHVLELARDRSGWGRPLASRGGVRRGRGVAVNNYNVESYIAMVADVEVGADGRVRVTRITTVVDCGIVLNPLGLTGQVESAITWGLSATLLGQVHFRNGAAVESSYADFPVMRLDAMPQLDIHLVPSDAQPGGMGEHPVPLVAPAVANAIAEATGVRVRTLPIDATALRAIR